MGFKETWDKLKFEQQIFFYGSLIGSLIMLSFFNFLIAFIFGDYLFTLIFGIPLIGGLFYAFKFNKRLQGKIITKGDI